MSSLSFSVIETAVLNQGCKIRSSVEYNVMLFTVYERISEESWEMHIFLCGWDSQIEKVVSLLQNESWDAGERGLSI